jgi:hypothetical protein
MSKYILYCVGRFGSVGIATRYGLDGPGIESRWGRCIPHPSRQVLGPTQPHIRWVPGLLPGSKAAGVWRWPPTPSSAEVKKSVERYLCSPLSLRALFLGELYRYCTSIDGNEMNCQCVMYRMEQINSGRSGLAIRGVSWVLSFVTVVSQCTV